MPVGKRVLLNDVDHQGNNPCSQWLSGPDFLLASVDLQVIWESIIATQAPYRVAEPNGFAFDEHFCAVLPKIGHHQLIHTQQLVENTLLHKLVIQGVIQWSNLGNLVANFKVFVVGEVQVLLDSSNSIPAHWSLNNGRTL